MIGTIGTIGTTGASSAVFATSLRFQAGPGLSLLALTTFLALALLAGWGYARPLAEKGRFARLMLAVRLIAAALLALILLDPVISHALPDEQRPVVAVLADTSRSMSIQDSVDGISRAAAAHRILFDRQTGLAAKLAENFRLEFYTFDSALNPMAARVAADRPFAADGESTHLRPALRNVVLGDQPGRLAAVVVLTDGRDLSPPADEPLPAGVPVHLIGLGRTYGDRAEKDLSVLEVRAGRRALVANRVQVDVVLGSEGLPPLTRELVLKRDGQPLKAMAVQLEPGSNRVSLGFTPKQAGTHDYEVVLQSTAGETNLDNNRRVFSLIVDARRVRVLYFEGAPRWKYRYLRQALQRDVNLSVTYVVKTGPSRFLQQGGSPVPLAGGLPATRQELAAFDCVILGDLSREDLTRDQLRMLHAYVNRDGGGLLFLGGGLAYGPDGLAGTALEDVLPAALDRRGGEVQGTLLVALTREGLHHPALQGVAPFFRGAAACAFPLHNAYRVGGVKPGAQVLAHAQAQGSSGTRFILLVAQRFGAGKTALFASDTDWRWWIERRDEGGERVFSQLWGQMLRWLSGREDPRLKRGAEPTLLLSRSLLTVGESVTVQVVGAGVTGVTGRIKAPGGETIELPFTATEDGHAARFLPRKSGRYEVAATITTGGTAGGTTGSGEGKNAAGNTGGGASGRLIEQTARFLVEADRREMEQTGLDEETLTHIAALTGGSTATAATAQEVPGRIAREALVEQTRHEFHPRNTPWFFAALVLFLGLEWWIRRRVYGI